MLKGTKISFIGGGNMAEAIIKGVLSSGLVVPDQITVSDPLTERLIELENRYYVTTTKTLVGQGPPVGNKWAVERGDIVILAVKPQVFPTIREEIRDAIKDGALVISIMAGVSIRNIALSISNSLAARALVRVMPNTPALVGQAMSVWCASVGTLDIQKEQVRAILQSFGKEIEAKHEEQLDMATAINGSGPAYVFLFIEALIDAGVHIGFSRPVAQMLVLETLSGSIALAKQSGRHPAELRNMVTSPAGTTAEALYQLESRGLRSALYEAVWAAFRKTKQLK